MDTKEEFSTIASKLEEFLSRHEQKCHPDSLQLPIDYILALPSKKVRPIACYLSHSVFAEPNDDVFFGCWSLEYFHDFTLMHDDIIDEAATRRGQESVYHKYGRNQAILSGDAMMIQSYQYLSRLNSDLVPMVLQRFNQTALEVCQGQQLDVDFESMTEVKYEDYLEMIRQKTAVLLAYSCWLGAVTATTSAENQENLYQFGLHLGIAFQLLDDYLDVFADEEKLGKKVGGDILMNKKTALYIKTLEELDNAAAGEFARKYAEAEDDKSVADVKKMMIDSRAEQVLLSEIKKYTDASLDFLKAIQVDEVYKESLQELTHKMLNRKY